MLNEMQRRAWAQIDLDALEYNYNTVRNILPNKTMLCCVVKADAYGHGAPVVAKIYERFGADYLAVSNINEAMILRNEGICTPILVLGYTPISCVDILSKYKITQCIYSYEYGKALVHEADKREIKITVHIKIDVGMGRLGFTVHDVNSVERIAELCKCDSIIPEGIFAHFPMAGEENGDPKITRSHYDKFLNICDDLSRRGINFKIKHCSNSAATLKYPEFSLDMVRVGIALYGVLPCNDISNIDLIDALSLRTIVSSIKCIKKGDTVGYGCEFVAPKDMTIATLPIGYADGFKCENFRNKTKISVRGVLCDIVGRVCMDQTMIDVSHISELKTDEEAVIYGEGSPISIAEFSKNNKKIPYEAMCEISARVPRVYIKDGKIHGVRESFT